MGNTLHNLDVNGFEARALDLKLTFPPRHLRPVVTVDPYRVDTDRSGERSSLFYRDGQTYQVSLPDVADYRFRQGISVIECWKAPHVSDVTAHRLFLNQIVPLIRSLDGNLVLHASAVEFEGQAFLFAGPSGAGKSTLATFLGAAGQGILSDDGVTISHDAESYKISAETKPVRIWQDSVEAVLTPECGQIFESDEAKRFVGSDAGLRFLSEPRPLGMIFYLEEENAAKSISIERLSPLEAMQKSLKNTFLLDDKNREAIEAHFEILTSLSNDVPQFNLHYPRRYDMLSKVSAELEALSARKDWT